MCKVTLLMYPGHNGSVDPRIRGIDLKDCDDVVKGNRLPPPEKLDVSIALASFTEDDDGNKVVQFTEVSPFIKWVWASSIQNALLPSLEAAEAVMQGLSANRDLRALVRDAVKEKKRSRMDGRRWVPAIPFNECPRDAQKRQKPDCRISQNFRTSDLLYLLRDGRYIETKFAKKDFLGNEVQVGDEILWDGDTGAILRADAIPTTLAKTFAERLKKIMVSQAAAVANKHNLPQTLVAHLLEKHTRRVENNPFYWAFADYTPQAISEKFSEKMVKDARRVLKLLAAPYKTKAIKDGVDILGYAYKQGDPIYYDRQTRTLIAVNSLPNSIVQEAREIQQREKQSGEQVDVRAVAIERLVNGTAWLKTAERASGVPREAVAVVVDAMMTRVRQEQQELLELQHKAQERDTPPTDEELQDFLFTEEALERVVTMAATYLRTRYYGYLRRMGYSPIDDSTRERLPQDEDVFYFRDATKSKAYTVRILPEFEHFIDAEIERVCKVITEHSVRKQHIAGAASYDAALEEVKRFVICQKLRNKQTPLSRVLGLSNAELLEYYDRQGISLTEQALLHGREIVARYSGRDYLGVNYREGDALIWHRLPNGTTLIYAKKGLPEVMLTLGDKHLERTMAEFRAHYTNVLHALEQEAHTQGQGGQASDNVKEFAIKLASAVSAVLAEQSDARAYVKSAARAAEKVAESIGDLETLILEGKRITSQYSGKDYFGRPYKVGDKILYLPSPKRVLRLDDGALGAVASQLRRSRMKKADKLAVFAEAHRLVQEVRSRMRGEEISACAPEV